MARIDELMASGDAAVSAVTVHELLRSPSLPAPWRAFYERLFAVLPVVPVGADAAVAAAILWAARQADASRETADALIAGTAVASGSRVVTCDAGLAALTSAAELVQPS